MKDINFHVVPLGKIPLKNKPKGLKGYHKPRTNDVYLVRGNYAKYDKLHETYHYLKRHPDYPRNPREFVEHEVEAQLYAYNEMKQPAHIKSSINYWVGDLGNHYNIGVANALSMIARILNSYPIPQAWREDFNDIMKQSYTGRKIPDYQKKLLQKDDNVGNK